MQLLLFSHFNRRIVGLQPLLSAMGELYGDLHDPSANVNPMNASLLNLSPASPVSPGVPTSTESPDQGKPLWRETSSDTMLLAAQPANKPGGLW